MLKTSVAGSKPAHQGTCRGNRDPSGWAGKSCLLLEWVCKLPTSPAFPEGHWAYLLCFAVNLIAVPIMVNKTSQGPLSGPGTRAITCPESVQLNFPAYLPPYGLLGTNISPGLGPFAESSSWHLPKPHLGASTWSGRLSLCKLTAAWAPLHTAFLHDSGI